MLVGQETITRLSRKLSDVSVMSSIGLLPTIPSAGRAVCVKIECHGERTNQVTTWQFFVSWNGIEIADYCYLRYTATKI